MPSLQFLQQFMSLQQYSAFSGQAFKIIRYIPTLAATVKYYQISVPADSSIVLIGRSLGADSGPLFLNEYPEATGISVGTEIVPENVRFGGGASKVTVNEVTVSSPGTAKVIRIVRGTSGGVGIKQPGTIGEGINDVIPANATIIIGIDPLAATINQILVEYDWIEIDPLEGVNV